jgi:hypothetical protein
MLVESPIPGDSIGNRRINQLWAKCPVAFIKVFRYWLLAMYNGATCYRKPLSINYIRINANIFINHLIPAGLNTDISNLVQVTSAAIAKCPRESYSTRKSILETSKSLVKSLIHKESLI